MESRNRSVYDALVLSGAVDRNITPFETHFGKTDGLNENDFTVNSTRIEIGGAETTVLLKQSSPKDGKVVVIYREILR